ncbi:DUF11 domain-containing protein [Microbacterium jejuense]|uniref:DUF11 domain-containing protein n=1 Tax=Microbacterium jejuense TaxID=1263637 RepID=A0ABS7HSC2_9MICO|nr:SpaA isopeptide-forming pilin-related protein [Microbacterium jejuense]MBW9095645.1 DUF11 domain-containing protein [Microbacterium jejuense]
MFSRTFVRASDNGGLRRRMRQQRTEERRLALQKRWYVGGIATVVSAALVFSGLSPAVAEEVTDPAATTQATDTTTDESTDATTADTPATEETATEPEATDSTPTEQAVVPEEAPVAPDTTTDAPLQALAAPSADVGIQALLACSGWLVGTPGGFEIDGNLCLDGTGTKDWATVGGQPVRVDGFDDSTAFTNGAKETNWPWDAGQIAGTASSGKTDMGNVYAYTQTVSGHVYAYLGFERQENNGSVAYHVELNQKQNTTGPVPNRTVNDLRLTINQTGNDTIALVGADIWTGSAWQSLGSLAGFVGQVNQGPINNLAGDELERGIFSEVAIDLTALFGDQGCSGNYGVVNVRSSASPSDQSSLEDWIFPISLNVPSTCATLKIVKTGVNGALLAGAEFTISPNPTTGTGSTTATTDANGQILFSGNVQPGVYTVTETKAPTGYLLPTSNNPQQVTLGDAESKTLTFEDPLGSVSWVKHDDAGALLGGATFQIVANTGGVAAGAAAFPRTVVDNGLNDADPDAGEFLVVNVPIGTYTVTETAAPAGYVLDATPQNFAVTQQAPNPSLTKPFVNIPFATVTLTKHWVNSFTGDTAELSISGAASNSGTSTAPTDGPVVSVSVAPGASLDLAEVLGDGNTGLYDSSLSCVGATPTANDGDSGSIVVPQYPASKAGVQCTFTNTAIERSITVKKTWVDAVVGDQAVLHAGPNQATSTATQPNLVDNTNIATVSVRVGDTVTLSEALSGVGTYGSSYVCNDEAQTSGTSLSFEYTVPDQAVTCVFTNTAQRATVKLQKEWIGAFAGDEAHLSITGAETDAATSVASGTDGIDDTFAQVDVRIGQKVTLSESITDADNTGRYTSTWSCDNGTSGAGRSIPELTVSGSVTCTITNTAKTIDVSVDKVWVNAFQGDSADLSIDGESATSTATGAALQTDAGVVTTTVRVGDDVTVGEVFGQNRGQYETGIVCSNVEEEVDGLTATFTAPEDADVTCVFTNTAKTATVVLHKRWIGALVGDKTTLEATPENGLPATKLSTMLLGSPTNFFDNVNFVTVTARIGALIPMKETLNAVGVYESSFLCSAGETTPVGTDGRAFTLKVTGPGILCQFINEAQSATVHLQKEWVNGQEGDTADLTIEGVTTVNGTSTSNGAVGSFVDTENAIEAEALIGEMVSVSELIDVVAGDASDYASSLRCVAGDQEVVLEGSGRSGEFQMPDQAVWCTFTNTAERPTLGLVKVVAGADVADTNWQLTGESEDDTVTDPGGDVEPVAVLPGEPFDLSEAIVGDIPGLDEFEAGLWSCVSDDEGDIELTDSEPGAAMLRGLDKGEHVVCTIVNTHVDQGIEFAKDLVSSEQNEDGTWTLTYELTVRNNSVLVPVTYDLSDTLDEVDGVEYLEATWTGPQSGSFDLDASLTADLAVDQVLAPRVGDAEDVYTVVVDLEVTSDAEAGTACDEEGDGIGVVNTATVTAGEFTDTDDACGTVHFDDVDIEKTASNLPEQGSVEPGDAFDYTLTVSNNGTRDAEDVVVTDPVHDRLEVTGITLPAGWVNDNDDPLTPEEEWVDGDNTIRLHTDTLAVGDSVDIIVSVIFTATPVPPVEPGDESTQPADPLESLSNTACVAAERDQVEENNCSTVEIPVREITAVVWTKCVADAPYLGWTIAKSAALVDEEIDFLWTPDTGTATTDPAEVALTQPGGTATWTNEIAWPGAEFTPSGVSIDYPGWRPIELGDIVPGSSPRQYYYPGTTDIISAADQPDYIFNGLILDDSELDYAWRLGSTITFTVNPELVFSTEYPAATPDCAVARHSDVQIEKTASVGKTDPGASFTYTLDVANVSDDSAADGVVVTDTIPADLKITDVSWPGEGDATAFPSWSSCAVTGQSGSGYGGTLTCTLNGPLQPQGAEGVSVAPTITLSATVSPTSTSSSITNIGVVDYYTFGNPDDSGRDADDAVVLLSALPATGGQLSPVLVLLGLLALLAGTTTLIVTRRRRGEAKPTL